MLAAEGVEVVFGIIDGTYFGLYSAFEENGIAVAARPLDIAALIRDALSL